MQPNSWNRWKANSVCSLRSDFDLVLACSVNLKQRSLMSGDDGLRSEPNGYRGGLFGKLDWFGLEVIFRKLLLTEVPRLHYATENVSDSIRPTAIDNGRELRKQQRRSPQQRTTGRLCGRASPSQRSAASALS